MSSAAAESSEVVAAWARHHLASADDAVQQYICGALLLAVEEGEGLRDQADMLAEFVPGTHSRGWLSDRLGELEAALRQLQPSPPWLRAPLAAPGPADGDSAGSEERGVASQAPDSHPPPPASALRVSAAEFRPAGAPPALAAAWQLSTLAPPLGCAGADSGPAAGEEEGEGGGPGRDAVWDAAGGSGHAAGPHAGHAWRAGEDAGWAAVDAGSGGGLAGGPAAHEAFLAVLSDQFPLFSHAALRQLFEEQQRSLADTIAMLCGLEAELQGQAAAAAAAVPAGDAAGLQHAASDSPAAPQFGEEDFPSLGPSPAGTESSRGPSSAAGEYASVARVAARSGGQPASRPRPRNTVVASAAAAPAPIWRQAEGVRQVATGAAVAAEYAALRSEARDHARLRNMCFQQATQAYLAGNFRLARELGAKGRWHGEQMHAAHATAATEIFARRNRDVLAGGGGGGGAPTLDLHGLHVAEALQQMERVLQGRKGGGRLRVVVGRGTHGKVPARLPAAVRRWLQDQGLPFTEPYAGLLEIDP